MTRLVTTAIGALLLLNSNCDSRGSGHAQTCAADPDCAPRVCELGTCSARAGELVEPAAPRQLAGDHRSPARPSPFLLLRDAPLEAFHVDLGERGVASPVLMPNGDVLVVGESGRAITIDSHGRTTSAVALSHRVVATPAVDIAGRVYAGCADGHVAILDAALRPLAELELGDSVLGALTVLPNGLVAIPTRGVVLVTSAGVELRRIPSPTTLRGGAAFHPLGMVVFGTPEGALVGTRLDGHEVFRVSVGASVDGSPAIGRDGAIYVGTDLGQIVRVSAAGVIEARLDVSADVRATPSFDSTDGLIAAGFDGRLHGLSSTLTSHFIAPLGGQLRASALVDAAGRIVVGSTLDRLHILGPDGAERARIPVGADILTTPTLTPDGVLVVVADDGIIRGYR